MLRDPGSGSGPIPNHLKSFKAFSWKKFFNIFSNFFKHFLASKCSSWAKMKHWGHLKLIFSKSMCHIQNPSDKNLDMIIIFSSLSFLSLTNEIHNYFRAITTLKNAFFQGFSMLHSKKWILRSKKSIFKNVWKSFLSIFGGQKTSSETQGVVLDPFRTI